MWLPWYLHSVDVPFFSRSAFCKIWLQNLYNKKGPSLDFRGNKQEESRWPMSREDGIKRTQSNRVIWESYLKRRWSPGVVDGREETLGIPSGQRRRLMGITIVPSLKKAITKAAAHPDQEDPGSPTEFHAPATLFLPYITANEGREKLCAPLEVS